jgi:hypothetical protein
VEDQPGHAWVTWGYTIENYVPVEILQTAVKRVHPSAEPNWDGNRYTNPLKFNSARTGESLSADKNRIAAEVCETWTDPATLPTDLTLQVHQILNFIRDAN